jgi:hypothetical protein
MLEFQKKEKIEPTSSDVDGGGSLGFCLFLLVSACFYFEENFWSHFHLFVKFERTLSSGSMFF